MALHRCRTHQACRQSRALLQQLAGKRLRAVSESNRSLINERVEPFDEVTQRAARGFSLIEMLVALVVLSLSLGALYQAAMGATRNVRVAAEYVDAVMLAESMLADHSYVVEENYGASGSFGRFDWQVSSWPAEYDDGLEPEQRAVAPQALQYLEVVVSWPGANRPRTLDLLTVVPLQTVTE